MFSTSMAARAAVVWVLGSLSAAASVVGPSAQAPTSDDPALSLGGSIPVQVVAGKLVVTCDLATAANRIPVNLFLEHEGRHGLQLHNKAAGALRAESADGTPRPITMLFPGFRIEVPARELGPEEYFEEFTKYYSAEMGENALVGSIGVEVLKDWTVTFALADGEVRLEPPASKEAVAATPGGLVSSTFVESDGTVVAPLSLLDDMAWLPVRWDSGKPAGIMLGTSQYDTRIDVRAARGVGRPAGDVGPVRIGEIDLGEYVALRPESVVEVHPDLALGITGIGLLESLEVRVDRARREVRIRPVREARYPEADFEFFQARAEESPEALTNYLEDHPKSRLAHEAARLLLDYSLADMAPLEEVQSAVKWIFDTMAGDLRTTRMLDLMKEMADEGETKVVVAAGQLGVESGRDDRYPNAVHEVHGLLGRTLLDQGDGDEAWRHLLSAAFGLPENGRVNYDLGRFYEEQKRYRRAFSRYVQAVISPETGGLAIDAMQRVQPLLGADGNDTREPYSVAMVERMIAGKVRSFGASSPFVKSSETLVLRTVLVEFFTNGHYGDEQRGGAIGGALGMEGLIGHFSPDSGVGGGVEGSVEFAPDGDAEPEAGETEPEEASVIFLEYHLPNPRPDALCNAFAARRAGELRVGGPDVIMIDGQVRSPGAAKWRQAEEVYNRGRRATLDRLATLGDHEIDLLGVSYEDGVLSGTVEVYGPRADSLAVEVVLAEGRVLYPGSSGVVVHRRVARGSLLGESGPLAYTAETVDEDADEVVFEFSRAAASIEAEMAAHLDELEAGGVGSAPRISMKIDPREMRVIAFLYDKNSGAILSADELIPRGIPVDGVEILDLGDEGDDGEGR